MVAWAAEKPAAITAVDATKGEIATYNGKIDRSCLSLRVREEQRRMQLRFGAIAFHVSEDGSESG